MQPSQTNLWTNEDFLAGLCSHLDIDKPKPEAQSPKPLALSPETKERTYAQKLNDLAEAAVDSVLNHPGGAKQWFKENPSAHVRILTKLATPAAESQTRIVVEIPWLQSGRLSYRNQTETVQDVEPKIIAAEPWKEPTPNPEIGLGIDALKKSMKPLGS